MSDFIPESSVNLERVFSILKAAFLKTEPVIPTEPVPAKEIRVRLQNCIALVSVDSSKKLINMHCIFGFRDNATIYEKLAFINLLNQNLIFCRFYTVGAEDQILCSDYYLSYEEGLIPFHLIGALKRLSYITGSGIVTYNERNLIV